MPSAMPPMIWGPPAAATAGRRSGLTEAGVAAGIGARARSPAMEPTGRSAGGAGAAAGAGDAAACGGRGRRCGRAAAAVGADQVIGRDRPARIELGILVVDDGRGRPTGLGEYVHRFGEPAALAACPRRHAVGLVQPAAAAASPAAHKTSAILETARRRKTVSPGRSIRLSLNTYFASSRWRRQAKAGQWVNQPLAVGNGR